MSIASCRQSCDRLAHQRMIGDLALAGEVLGAGDLVGEDRGEQVLGVHALKLRRHLLAAAEARQRERDRRRPSASACRTSARRAAPGSAPRARCSNADSARTSSSGKLCAVGSESTMASSVAAACSSKLNLRQKRLRSARPQARLMPAAERRVDDELHAAGLVEEALEARSSRCVGSSRAPHAPRRR